MLINVFDVVVLFSPKQVVQEYERAVIFRLGKGHHRRRHQEKEGQLCERLIVLCSSLLGRLVGHGTKGECVCVVLPRLD